MKKFSKFTKFTYIYHRILLGIVFAVSLIGIFVNEDDSVKSDYIFNCAQSGVFLIVSFVPNLMKKLDFDIPDFIYFIFIVFCLAHFFCGEILGFFVKVSWWDSALHTFSGMLIALLSFSLINLLSKKNGNGIKLNTFFCCLFAFSLTITVGVLWEIIEFAMDGIFGTNMQRAYVSTMSGRGAALLGTSALADTMKDLILDAIGALVVCVICAIFVYKKKVKIEDLTFIKKKKVPVENLNEVVGSLKESVAVADGNEQETEAKQQIVVNENEEDVSLKEKIKAKQKVKKNVTKKTSSKAKKRR